MTDFIKEGRVGDKVYSLRFGEGAISDLVNPVMEDYPVAVQFQDKVEVFMKDGRFYPTDKTPDLYWPGVKVIDGPAPKRKKKIMLDFWVNVYYTIGLFYQRKVGND